jgi:hypothetical protein
MRIGEYILPPADASRMRSQLVLIELHKVRAVIDRFSERFCDRSPASSGAACAPVGLLKLETALGAVGSAGCGGGAGTEGGEVIYRALDGFLREKLRQTGKDLAGVLQM